MAYYYVADMSHQSYFKLAKAYKQQGMPYLEKVKNIMPTEGPIVKDKKGNDAPWREEQYIAPSFSVERLITGGRGVIFGHDPGFGKTRAGLATLHCIYVFIHNSKTAATTSSMVGGEQERKSTDIAVQQRGDDVPVLCVSGSSAVTIMLHVS